MSIIGQNSLLNQYVPTFLIKNIENGQTLAYNSTLRAFVNSNVPLEENNAGTLDVIPTTLTVGRTYQYIVTSRLEILGHVINNGRIAIL